MKNIIIVLVVCIYCSSCSNSRRFTYFRDVPDTIINYTVPDTGYKMLVIQPDDILLVHITSPNSEATSFFLTPGSVVPVNTPGATPAAPNTYLVDKTGNIDLPLVGTIYVKGLTSAEAGKLIKQKVAVYLKDPIVSVRFYNFKITVLGEVNRPANYIVPSERISVMEALGMAGDLTLFGQRENVLLIREKDGKKVLNRLNLNSSEIFQTPYYYLQQNDILYVEPNKDRAASSDLTRARNLSILTSLVGLATIILVRIK